MTITIAAAICGRHKDCGCCRLAKETNDNLLSAERARIDALEAEAARLRKAGSALAGTLKASKAALVHALPRRELELLMADLHNWNVAALQPNPGSRRE